jgi:hypothetical protein
MICMDEEEFKMKWSNLRNWVLVLVKEFWILVPQNQFYKRFGQKFF